jgi:hypothetical protein
MFVFLLDIEFRHDQDLMVDAADAIMNGIHAHELFYSR